MTLARPLSPTAMPGTKIAEALRREQIVDGGVRSRHPRRPARRNDPRRRAKGRHEHRLIIFHFGTKDRLVLALLDSVLAKTTALTVGTGHRRHRRTRSTDSSRSSDRRWSGSRPSRSAIACSSSSGTRACGIAPCACACSASWIDIARRSARWREDVIAADPSRFDGVTAADLAAVAVSFIKGCAVQSMVEPDLDVAGFLRAAEALLAAPSPARQSSCHLCVSERPTVRSTSFGVRRAASLGPRRQAALSALRPGRGDEMVRRRPSRCPQMQLSIRA